MKFKNFKLFLVIWFCMTMNHNCFAQIPNIRENYFLDFKNVQFHSFVYERGIIMNSINFDSLLVIIDTSNVSFVNCDYNNVLINEIIQKMPPRFYYKKTIFPKFLIRYKRNKILDFYVLGSLFFKDENILLYFNDFCHSFYDSQKKLIKHFRKIDKLPSKGVLVLTVPMTGNR